MRAIRWKAIAAVGLVAVETAALFWAYYAYDLAGVIRGLESSPAVHGWVDAIMGAIRGAVPAWIWAGVTSFVASIGFRGGVRDALAVGTVLASWVSVSSIGSAIIAPAYFAARRLLRRASAAKGSFLPKRVPGSGGGSDAKLLEPGMRASTAVQEPL